MAEDRENGWDIGLVSDAPWEAYYGALGRFVQMFGLAEVALHRVLKDLITDLNQDKGGIIDHNLLDAIIGPMRFATLKDNIKRIIRVAKVDDWIVKEFDAAFLQLGEIHYFRDRIVHTGAQASGFDPVVFLTSNGDTIREYEQHEILAFSTDHLLDMAHDLSKMPMYFIEIENILYYKMVGREDFEEHVNRIRPAWRYKPSSLEKAGPKHRPKPQAHKRPRSPSRESQRTDPSPQSDE